MDTRLINAIADEIAYEVIQLLDDRSPDTSVLWAHLRKKFDENYGRQWEPHDTEDTIKAEIVRCVQSALQER